MLKIYKTCSHSAVDYAARELKKYLRMMMPRCGDIAVYSDPAATDGFRLGLASHFGISLETDTPEADDVVHIDTTAQGGIIAGSNYRSVLQAVYRYLELCGCRWLLPGVDGEFIPVRDIEPIKYHKMADLRVRALCNEGAENQTCMLETIDLIPKLGMNSYMLEFDNPKVYYNYYYDHRHNTANRPPEPISAQQVLQWKRVCECEIADRGLIFQDMGHGWTAAPFGLDTNEGWDKNADQSVPSESRDFVALCEGVRGLYHGVALNTNFCMSNPEARDKVATAVADYAENSPHVSYLHVWLADNKNNHCECEACRAMTPSDWYAALLNDIDQKLTERGLDTRIVFVVYYDTAWPPRQVKVKNPARFTMLLAAITRRYTETPKMAADPSVIPPFELNKNVFPADLGEYMALMWQWDAMCPSEKFCYEYHFWIHQFYDLGGVQIARRLYEDVAAYRAAGISGIIQDGSQRSFFPNGFPFYVYSRAMLDKDITFEALAEDYFSHAYGDNWQAVYEYLDKIGKMFDVNYLEHQHHGAEKSYYAPERAEALRAVPALVDEMLPLLRQLKDSPYRVRTVAARLLMLHAEYCKGLSEACALKAEGHNAEAYDAFTAAMNSFGRHEVEIERYYDHHLANSAFKRKMFKKV